MGLICKLPFPACPYVIISKLYFFEIFLIISTSKASFSTGTVASSIKAGKPCSGVILRRLNPKAEFLMAHHFVISSFFVIVFMIFDLVIILNSPVLLFSSSLSNSTNSRQPVSEGRSNLMCLIMFLSISSKAEGLSLTIFAQSVTACSKFLYDNMINTFFFGCAKIFSFAEIIMPSVPSEPAIIFCSSFSFVILSNL